MTSFDGRRSYGVARCRGCGSYGEASPAPHGRSPPQLRLHVVAAEVMARLDVVAAEVTAWLVRLPTGAAHRSHDFKSWLRKL
jgi:hypothetical protein